MATAQAKAAIDQLKAAGLNRDQFSVTTERRYVGKINGRACYEYGDAKISIKMQPSQVVPLGPALAAAGLHVEIWKFENMTTAYVTTGKPGLWEKDYTNTDDYGLPKTKRIK